MKSKEEVMMGELLLVKQESCNKVSSRASGMLQYRVVRDAKSEEVFVAITGNETSGYFSREYVPVSAIEKCLGPLLKAAKPFPSSKLKSVFVGRSVNNASFLAAILRNEGLLEAAPDSETMNVGKGDLGSWSSQMQLADATLIVAPVVEGVSKEAPPPAEDPGPAPEKKKRGGKSRKTDMAIAPTAIDDGGADNPEPHAEEVVEAGGEVLDVEHQGDS